MALKILYGGTDHDVTEAHLKAVLDKASQIGLNMVIMATKKANVVALKAEQAATGTNAMKKAVVYGRSLNPPVEQGICIDLYSYPPVFPPDPANTDGNNNLYDPNYITNRPTTMSGVYLNTAEYYQTAYITDAVWLLQNTDANYFEVEEAVFCCKYDAYGKPIPDPSRIVSLTAFLKRIRTALKAVKSSIIVGCNIPSADFTGMRSEGLDPETLAGKPSNYNNHIATPQILDYITMQSGVADPVSFMNTYNIMKNLVAPNLQVNAVIFIAGNETLNQPGCNRSGTWTKACFNQNYIGCLKALLQADASFGIFSTMYIDYSMSVVDYQNAPPEVQIGSISNATKVIIASVSLTGTLDMSSTPSGAAIQISDDGGITWGNYGITPRIKEWAPGNITVKLSLSGYEDAIISGLLIPGTTLYIYNVMTPISIPPPPCIPVWQCEQPLNGYETNGCGNRQLNPVCDPVIVPPPKDNSNTLILMGLGFGLLSLLKKK